MLKNYLKITLRNLVRQKGYTLINICGLAIGIAVVLLIYIYVANENRYDQFIDKKDRIYRVERWRLGGMPTLVGHVLMGFVPEVEKATRVYYPANLVCKKGENLLTINNFIWADSTFFDMFNFKFIAGDPKTALNRPLTVVLTESEAKKLFDNEPPLGKTILCENQFALTVTGVIKDVAYFHLPFRAVGSLITTGPEFLKQFDSWDFPTFVLLPGQHDVKQITEIINKKLNEFGYFGDPFALRKLSDIYFTRGFENEKLTIHGDKTGQYIFITIAIFILLISMVNYVNLATVRTSLRAKEISVKKIVGARKSQVIRQFLLESVLISLLAMFLGFLLAELLLPVFNQLVAEKLSLDLFKNPGSLAILVVSAIMLGIVAGLYPAFHLHATNPITMLKGNPSRGAGAARLRKALILCQFVISITLIIGTFLVQKQLQYIQTKELGFQKSQIILLRNNVEIGRNMNAFRSELSKHTSIEAVTFSRYRPGEEWAGWCCVFIDNDQQDHSFKINSVDPDYIQTLGFQLVQGRNFDRNQTSDMRSTYIITESAAKEYGMKAPLGRRLSHTGNGSEGVVIGVVKDFHHRSLHKKIDPALFTWDETGYGFTLINVKIAAQNIPQSIADIERVWQMICPDFPFAFEFLDQSLNFLYQKEERLSQVIQYFSILAILIAGLGILGLSAFTVERRTKEIGIRKVLGATVSGIVMLISKTFIKWVLLANILAWPIAWYVMNRWLQNFAYRIQIGWWVFVLAGVLTATIAWVTMSFLTIKAALA
ncbi:ABC transporter permease, partial [candidate division KSB1 bacterium]|nr:ABC transporter permease [candidate division KSB1 bacterium]